MTRSIHMSSHPYRGLNFDSDFVTSSIRMSSYPYRGPNFDTNYYSITWPQNHAVEMGAPSIVLLGDELKSFDGWKHSFIRGWKHSFIRGWVKIF